MNGPQDMGGLQGFGPVVPEPDEPVFHAEWEKSAMALTVAMGFMGVWNIDMSRHARESLAPADYISWSYYRIWLTALENMLVEQGLAADSEIRSGKAETPRAELKAAPGPEAVPAILRSGGPSERAPVTPAKYAVGDKVKTCNINPAGHTRLPRYARAKHGEIVRINGVHVFPDSNAAGQGENPHWLYSVRFDAKQLWGEDALFDGGVNLDCWEPYIEPA